MITDDAQATSGATDNPSSGGEAGESSTEGKTSGVDNASETVPYKTYSKLLTEKRNTQERVKTLESELSKFKTERKEAETKALEEQNEYKKLYETAKAELDENKGMYNGLVQDIHKQRKIAAFTAALQGSVDPDYHIFIKTDEILMDPESGEIDEMSVTKEVERFTKKHAQLVARPHEKRSTSVYPQGENHMGDKIARSEWLKLPAKEMRKWRMNQIIADA